MRRAVAMITQYRTHLDSIAGALLTHEVLDGDDITRIMDGVELPEPSGRISASRRRGRTSKTLPEWYRCGRAADHPEG